MKTPFVLILGENNSGKSLFAEALVRHAPFIRRMYIATMRPEGEEGQRRVTRHRAQRAADGYITLEAPAHIGALKTGRDAVVLLEDVTNFVANLYFDAEDPAGPAEALREIRRLLSGCGALVAVSIRMPDSSGYAGETAHYIEAVNTVNERLFALADTVIEMCGGEAACVKGALPW